ncbi:DNA mismatch repair endonuclease MutL [Tepidiforma thermophila]|uniref:DNA mismatch repair protein MutL n=1 Tax=Tepidiforma thermophila (strain KCTC 52669 / CGMCC 1.13589 / G233) TaxID=2761530 RepID=A0A2A9HFF5_TEPT2|nr:DNA mismatch repair endonuclease MutL [Tepidiforma thermophila]PFG74767.1 DNA mismatch repair protein MutL [Tepidiforma thermophila]
MTLSPPPVPAIRVLPPEVAARIAAGEVVERPVSVVRELLDNAIDAGATRISLAFDDGGLSRIEVSDDGRGIPPGDVELAFERHATSKIASIEDLHRVHTLGFRGEALPSIAAAADVEVLTRARGEPVGVFLALVNGRPVRRMARPAPEGTTITVRDLFARVPARRKFLGSPAAEARAITTLAMHYALAYPGIAFQVVNSGRRILATSGDDDMRHAFAAVYGAEIARQVLEVDDCDGGVAVTGLAAPPSIHRGNRGGISVFVNGRWVQSRPLLFAVVEAYQSQLPVGRFPLAALHLRLPEDDVDVNVHPAKAEVRFRDERRVARALRHAVRAALEAAAPVTWVVPGHEPAAPTASLPADVADVRAPLPGTQPPAPRAAVPPGEPPVALRGPVPTQGVLALSRVMQPPVPPAAGPTAHSHRDVLPLLRVVGQLNATYIVAEGPDGMYLVDQHAAHERVVYDRLLAQRAAAGAPAVQPLLEPLLIETGAALAAVAAASEADLRALGLVLEPFGEGVLLLRQVPVGFRADDPVAAVVSVLEAIERDERVPAGFGRAAATVACHSSVRAGMALSTEEMRRLLEDLAATATPRTCPHGRPTLVLLGTEAIERQFGRR